MSGSPGSALIIVENLPVPLDRRVWMEATTLRDDGWAVRVICPATPQHPESHEVIDGIEVMRHPLPPEGSTPLGFLREYVHALWHEARLTRRAWQSQRFDVVHVCNPPDLLFTIAAWYRLVHGARVVFDQHDLGPELFVAKYGKRGFLHRSLLLCERLTYLTAHHVIATNDTYRRIAMSRGHKDPDEVTVVRSAPDVQQFQAVEPGERYRQQGRHLLGYVGVMGDQEGLDIMLSALRHIVITRGRRDVELMLIGGGPALESLKSVAQDLGVADFVEFTGRIPDEELIERLSSVDVCVAPDPANGFNELCTMNKVMEYMALGKPIVQFDLHEGRRSAGDASLYARPNDPAAFGDAVLGLLDAGPARRQEMGRIGTERMRESLGWEHQRRHLLTVYSSLSPARTTRRSRGRRARARAAVG